MIEGLVRHDTEMRVEKNFVDSHGQSEVAFAFCHLLGAVRLMPRLKRIKYERLYLPEKGTVDLVDTFARPDPLGSDRAAVRRNGQVHGSY